jgi:hypothetical protein
MPTSPSRGEVRRERQSLQNPLDPLPPDDIQQNQRRAGGVFDAALQLGDKDLSDAGPQLWRF